MPKPTRRAGCRSCRCSSDNRAKQPINGVILAISLEDVLLLPEDELAGACQRDPQAPARTAPGTEDRFPGLCAVHQGRPDRRLPRVFRQFHRDAAAQGLGRDVPDRGPHARTWSAQVPAEFDALTKRLTEELPDRLQEEPDADRAHRDLRLPGAVRGAARRASPNSSTASSSRPATRPTPICAASISRPAPRKARRSTRCSAPWAAASAVDDSARHLSGRGKSFFLHDLLTQRHLRRVRLGFARQERGATRRGLPLRRDGRDRASPRSRLLGAWGWSYSSNKALISTAGAAVEDYRIAAKEELSRKEISGAEQISGADLTVIASHLSAAAHHAGRLCAYGRDDAARRDLRAGAARPPACRIGGHLPQRAGADAALAPHPAAGAADHRLA